MSAIPLWPDCMRPTDAAAALAFRWAQNKGPWLFDTPQTGPAMQAMAERVMRAVQADPTLLDRSLAGNAPSMAALKAVAQGTTVPGSGIETRTDEERLLVAQMLGEGKSGAEIEAALDELRKRAGAPSRLVLPPNPDDLLKDRWVETSNPNAAATGHREFKNPQTGEEVWFDKGRPGKPGFEGKDHHRVNPSSTSKQDSNLDVHGNPVPRGNNRSHIIPGETR